MFDICCRIHCRGRFDVFEGDNVLNSSTAARDQARKEREERERDESRRGSSGPLVSERVVSSSHKRDDDQDRSLYFYILSF